MNSPQLASSNRLVLLGALPALVGLLAIYLMAWAIWYRIPCEPPKTLDIRIDRQHSARFVSLCSALANNPHGFPGHCFITVGTAADFNAYPDQSGGFGPALVRDQIPSLWCAVPGLKCRNVVGGNTRNLDRLTLIMDEHQFLSLKNEQDNWQDGSFKVGERDCVAFVHKIAQQAHLRTPHAKYRFPQDYIRELKRLN